jgi:hypothetical protein
VDSAWEQEKPEARKKLENAADSHPSAARCVRQPARRPERWQKKRHNREHAQLLHRTYFLAMTKTELARRQSKQKRKPTTNKNRSHETKPIKPTASGNTS